MWGALYDERTGLSFTTLLAPASAVTLGSKSREAHDHILLPQIRDYPQPAGSGSRIYIPQEKGGPVTPPGTGFPFRRLLRLAGLRWRPSLYSLWEDPIENTVSNNFSIAASRVRCRGKLFVGISLAMAVSSGFTIPVSQLPYHSIFHHCTWIT
jgi:hypothetical protein